MSVYINTFLYTDDYNIMSLVVEKLTHTNFPKFEKKLLQSLKEEYKATYNLILDDTQSKQLIDYCISYMYVLVLKISTSSKMLGYFSISRTDLNKTKSFVKHIINYTLGYVFVFDVYVFPKYRRKGIGTYLVRQAVCTTVKDFQAKRIFLYIQSSELSSFYNRNGFSYKASVKFADNNSLLLLENNLQ